MRSPLMILPLLLLIGTTASAEIVSTLSPQYRGWVQDEGFRNGSSRTNSYFVGVSNSDVYRNWFTFNVGQFTNRWVTAATLRMNQISNYRYRSNVSYSIRDMADSSAISFLSSNGATLRYYDSIENRPEIGSLSGSNLATSGNLEVDLNADGVAAINAASLDVTSRYFDRYTIAGMLQTTPSNTGLQGAYHFGGSTGRLTDLQVVHEANQTPLAATQDHTLYMNSGGVLDASGTSDSDVQWGDSLVYRWDLDGDQMFDLETLSSTITLDEQAMDNLGLAAGEHNASLQVEDRWGLTNSTNFNLRVAAVPEPAAWMLFAISGAFLLVYKRSSQANRTAI